MRSAPRGYMCFNASFLWKRDHPRQAFHVSVDCSMSRYVVPVNLGTFVLGSGLC